MTATDLPIGSLFSGVGGLDLAVQAALGGHLAWHAETDPHAAQVLTRHWPDVPNLGDVAAIDWHHADPVCVLTAGFPCQDLSVAGPRTGLAVGTRSGLWRHAAHAIEALNPCLVVIENVRGLLSTRAALGVLLADLADLGYDANWTCVRASDIGAPHRRERVFLTAWPATPAQRAPAEDTESEPGQQRRLPTPGQTQGRTPRPHPGRRDRTPPAHPNSQRRRQGLTEPASRRRQPHPCFHRGIAHRSQRIHRRCSGGQDRLPAAHPDLIRRKRRRGHDTETQGRAEPPHRCHSPARWWGAYLPAIRRWEHVTQRPAPRPTAPGTRRLSAEFVEWMMGLDGHITGTPGLSRAAQLRLLGNSVVPHQAARSMGILLPDGVPCHGSLWCGTRVGDER